MKQTSKLFVIKTIDIFTTVNYLHMYTIEYYYSNNWTVFTQYIYFETITLSKPNVRYVNVTMKTMHDIKRCAYWVPWTYTGPYLGRHYFLLNDYFYTFM